MMPSRISFRILPLFVPLIILVCFPEILIYSIDAQNFQTSFSAEQPVTLLKNQTKNGEDICADCRLVSESISDLIRQPRQMDAYGQVDDRIDLNKIKKTVCRDIVSDSERERCRNFYFQNIASVEKWKKGNSRMSFFDFVCIKELKYCCPRNSYGPKCVKCIQCNSREHCQGEGTRTGNGSCVCKEGHAGLGCASCIPGYYLEQTGAKTDPKKSACVPCHRSCLYCRQGGPLGCEVCRSGFTWTDAYGCSDIDECVQNKRICGDNTFCVNTEGSYFCYECDRSCDGCYGDGPDMCLRCARGYKKEKENCVAMKTTILPQEANYYRYAIYLGMCLSTCIILHNSVYIASLVGLGVAMYIGVSEYIMSTHLSDMQRQVGKS